MPRWYFKMKSKKQKKIAGDKIWKKLVQAGCLRCSSILYLLHQSLEIGKCLCHLGIDDSYGMHERGYKTIRSIVFNCIINPTSLEIRICSLHEEMNATMSVKHFSMKINNCRHVIIRYICPHMLAYSRSYPYQLNIGIE